MVVFSQQPFSFDGIKPWLYIWTMKTTLSERLKEARLARGLTQKALGDLVGVSQAAIQKIETGKANQTTKIVEIANALGVRAEWRCVIFWRWKYVRQYSATNTINCQPFQILQD
ncbi:hypothetical protein EIMP300_60290 [Escherichia coli]|uniref:HTH cro/C1-type domain-containing protein n=1 Tax=Escherichia coli TaxID=562 RepID=A0A8S0FXH5_ECOLX|nr:hypothetical protein EIMP300_60290 [Escherichia coli]